ncbi:hypothetical protein TSUD_133790, partial [Trifolium subterraneum]
QSLLFIYRKVIFVKRKLLCLFYSQNPVGKLTAAASAVGKTILHLASLSLEDLTSYLNSPLKSITADKLEARIDTGLRMRSKRRG